MAVEVQLIEEPSVVGEVTIPSEGTLSSQDPALVQAWLDSTVSSGAAAGASGLSCKLHCHIFLVVYVLLQQYEVVVYKRYSVFTALNWQQVDSNNAAPLPVMFLLGSEETVAQALLQLHHNAERFAQSLDTSSVFTIHMTSSRTFLDFQALRGMKDATVRQAAALERLAEEVSQQRAVAERQTAALEHLVEELKGFRTIGNLARAISTAFQQQAPESQ
ncbi:hypothetical protein HPB50_017076 [Hyalomma asiaticum]|uniref:Uncharacterized protein n=1 Tax=Hyalomma asiaticum TaxID=266040 RepID=A0ACB7SXB0_HYAAI|nr:hypothetical protein HPB50_017076 [Hyalomma asiaticum]